MEFKQVSDFAVKTEIAGTEYVPIVDLQEPDERNRNKRVLVDLLRGADGSELFLLQSNPPSTLGSVSDVCINISTRICYQKNSSGAWINKGTIGNISGVVRTVNSVQPDQNGLVTLGINDIFGLAEQLTALETEITNFASQLATTSGANLVGYTGSASYDPDTIGAVIQQLSDLKPTADSTDFTVDNG